MVRLQRSQVLLPTLILALGGCAFLLTASRLAFVSQRQTQAHRTALRAEAAEEDTQVDYKLPKPDLGLLNRNAKIGQTYDQDKKGNMWAVEQQPVRKAEDEPLPAAVFIPGLIVLTIGAIIYFAILTGNDPRFGGSIGDGSFSVGD
mmetsp:Transcript_78475/g.216920  ORF Transcript_78475/g.216920 Transcript_78475/m.216920 type:complete len:146 (-) Transcript_78475:106-543(-)